MGRSLLDNYIMGLCSNERFNCSLYDSTFISKSIHFDSHTHLIRLTNYSDENYKWNSIMYSRKRLTKGSLCDRESSLILKSSGSYVLYNNTGPCRHVPLVAFLSKHAINNTVLLMIVDNETINTWKNSYTTGHLSRYKNLVVFCLDEQSYKVNLIICS